MTHDALASIVDYLAAIAFCAIGLYAESEKQRGYAALAWIAAAVSLLFALGE